MKNSTVRLKYSITLRKAQMNCYGADTRVRPYKKLIVMLGRWDFLGALELPGQFGRRVDEIGEALRADIGFLPLVLNGH